MRVWMFVEGPSDQLALNALWTDWKARLRLSGHSIGVVHLTDKARYLHKIGPRAAEKLAGSPDDVVVGLPDLYPTAPYQTAEFRHADLGDLRKVQEEQV